MRIFAIESSCDETAAAVLEAEESTDDSHSLRLLSNVVSTQIPIHALYGGVVPEIASRAHAENISCVVRQAFKDAAQPVYDKYGPEIGEDLINQVNEINQKYVK